MDAIDELAQLDDSMHQAYALLANEDVDENSSSSRRPSTFLNVVALGNTNVVLALDSSALDIVQVENLIKFCPTKEEMTMLKNYNGTNDMLGKCETVFPRLDECPASGVQIRGKRICKIASSNADDSHYRKCIEPRHFLRYYSVSKLKDFTGKEKPTVIT